MSFREKSAWAMALIMALNGLLFLGLARLIPADAPGQVQLVAFVPFVAAVIIGSIVVQVVLAIYSPRDAQRPADERERAAIAVSGNWSGIVLGVGVVCGILDYLWWGQGNRLFFFAIGSLIVAQVAEYVFQIILFRRGV
ncbi:hypothetical protein GCM10009127_11640 [Alteraurantiacibacter aestuarii]|uniref:Uncharacterized protein n=1 Tax=Alteraurantiacibacter aestuarii TaxID=650004 RepID=A0A844ZGA4_9SPHN|nr:hypothetical protein [Alteraurantiacibacter aestuarii]MXO87551.1 hypothetical protein [Alteraurantiacibacter aestuarii]